MMSGDTWKKFAIENPESACALKRYLEMGGDWGTIMFLPEYQAYMRFENGDRINS